MKKREEKALIALTTLLITGAFLLTGYLLRGVWVLITSPNKKKKEQERRLKLIEKYNDAILVSKIMDQTLWVGQTTEQVSDSIGSPIDIDQKVLKTKKKEIWKYHHRGGNRYGLRITLENDVVVGWDEKL